MSKNGQCYKILLYYYDNENWWQNVSLFVICLVVMLVLSISTIQSFLQVSIRAFAQGNCDPTIATCTEPPPITGCDPTIATCTEPPPITGCDPTIATCPEPPGPACDPTIQTCQRFGDTPGQICWKVVSYCASSDYKCDIHSPLLKVGSKGEKVKELQTYLTDMGFAQALEPEGIDGKFGPHTKNSVMQFQNWSATHNGSVAPVDGKVGPMTWEDLCIGTEVWFQKFTPQPDPPDQGSFENP